MLEMHLNNISGPGCPLSSDPDCIEGQSQNNTTLAPPWGRPVGWGRPGKPGKAEGERRLRFTGLAVGSTLNTQHQTPDGPMMTDGSWSYRAGAQLSLASKLITPSEGMRIPAVWTSRQAGRAEHQSNVQEIRRLFARPHRVQSLRHHGGPDRPGSHGLI